MDDLREALYDMDILTKYEIARNNLIQLLKTNIDNDFRIYLYKLLRKNTTRYRNINSIIIVCLYGIIDVLLKQNFRSGVIHCKNNKGYALKYYKREYFYYLKITNKMYEYIESNDAKLLLETPILKNIISDVYQYHNNKYTYTVDIKYENDKILIVHSICYYNVSEYLKLQFSDASSRFNTRFFNKDLQQLLLEYIKMNPI